MYLYEIRNTVNNAVYVGITRSSVERRWYAHRSAAKRGVKSILYDAMRSLGIDKFYIQIVKQFDKEGDLLNAEKEAITFYRGSEAKCYNILDGGEAYFPIKDWEEHKVKLRKARAGRKPSLGMKHSEENKKLFSEHGKRRWDIYGRYPDNIIELRFIDAQKQYGISKTHFYRLRKLAETNDLS
jgi:group I intron endonuclease